MEIQPTTYRVLGKTGISVSPLGMGAWQLGGPLVLDGKSDGHPDPGRDRVIDLIRRCGEAGINFIDTAEQYGDGESERRVGEAIRGCRDQWVVSTKFGAQVGPNGERVNDVSAARVPISLEGSLRRLGTDYVDIYLYHATPNPAEMDKVAAYLAGAKAAGKVRAVGFSGNSLAVAHALQEAGCLDVIQYESNILAPQEELRSFLRENNVGGVVRGAMAGGRLSGKYFAQGPKFHPNDIRKNWFGAEEDLKAFTRMAVFAKHVRPNETMAGLALRFLWGRAGTESILLGGKCWEDYAAALEAWALPPLATARVDALLQTAETVR